MRRELTSRFRDSLLGWVWAVFSPLALLAGYTIVFSIAAPVVTSGMSTFDYAASIFCGLVVYNVFAELIARGPLLLHEHAQFVKKSIFPSETIAWTATIRAFVYGAISFGVLLVVLLVIGHGLPWTLILTPLVFVPFFLLMLGTVWILMALGAFTKDVSHLVIAVAPMLMFVTPVFFTGRAAAGEFPAVHPLQSRGQLRRDAARSRAQRPLSRSRSCIVATVGVS